MMKLIVLFASLATLANAQVPGLGACPNVTFLDNVDMAMFSGKWYVSERFDSLFDNGKCVVHNIMNLVVGNMLTTKVTDPVTNVESTYVGGSAALGQLWPGAFVAVFPTAQVPIPVPFHIIATNYTSYAVAYSCLDVGFAHMAHAWVLTRDKIPSDDVSKAAYNVFDTNSIDRKNLRKVNQTTCNSGH